MGRQPHLNFLGIATPWAPRWGVATSVLEHCRPVRGSRSSIASVNTQIASNFQNYPQSCWEFHDRLWEVLSGTTSEKRGVLSRTGGGERILEMLWSLQMPWIIGLGGSQPYSPGEFQETLWERFWGLSGIFPEFLPESPNRTVGMAQFQGHLKPVMPKLVGRIHFGGIWSFYLFGWSLGAPWRPILRLGTLSFYIYIYDQRHFYANNAET